MYGPEHFVARLLPARYEVWERTAVRGNANTERQLRQVSGATHLFLIRGIAGREVQAVVLEDDDGELA